MHLQEKYWLEFTIGLFIIMLVLVPLKAFRKLLGFGFWMGLVQALILLGLAQNVFGVFRVIGSPMLMGIPILTALSWFPPAVLFAYFFPLMRTLLRKVGYILLFALLTALTQYFLSIFGMWANMRWNPYYTFIIAIITHFIMVVFYHLRYRDRTRLES